MVVTPNTLSEASNLLRQINEPARSQISLVFNALIRKHEEIYIRSSDASSRQEFAYLGLSDSALLEASKKDVLILSVDHKLCVAAAVANYPVLNFNHLREKTTLA
jgi:hypothetical protein